MKCPFCGYEDTKVRDSRAVCHENSVRRRRACLSCGSRFTTLEYVNLRKLHVIKRDGRREPFMRTKLESAIRTALSKRNVSEDCLQDTIDSIVNSLETSGDRDIDSKQIGALVMQHLANIDLVAYVRFASVYCNFQRIKDFSNFIESQLCMESRNDKSEKFKDGD